MTGTVIVGYARSPFHLAQRGSLATVRPDDLLAETAAGLLNRLKIPREEIEDFIVGCAMPEAEQGVNIARIAGRILELPFSVGGTTVNRLCGSSMQAIHMAAGAIALGAGRVFLCGGIESMSRVPMTGYNFLPNPTLIERQEGSYTPMGITAENLARNYQITRAEQEEFAVLSHQRAATAQSRGRLKEEIIPINNKQVSVAEDGCIRSDISASTLARLAPAFESNGTVTAGTSSPLTDGASAVLVCAEDYARAHGLKPMSKLKSIAISGCDPRIMGIGPVISTQKALQRAGLTIDDLDIVELNEAFASQVIACMRDLKLDLGKTNIDGGALAIGHPLGATGARIVGKAASLLQREGKQFALATQCIGGGQGIATILEAV